MNISISKTRPTTKPLSEYETRFIYVGFRFRYNTHTKTLSSIDKQSDGTITYVETPSETEVFSKGYHTEIVRMIIYSESPRIWCEEVSPTDSFVFSELGNKVLR